MQVVTCHHGQLQVRSSNDPLGANLDPARKDLFRTGLPALDELCGGALARGAIHELLALPDDPQPLFMAALLAVAATSSTAALPLAEPEPGQARSLAIGNRTLVDDLRHSEPSRCLVWSDPHQQLYPPALLDLGLDLNRLIVLRPASDADEVWAMTECLGCRAVGALVGAPRRLTRVQARRLQLAAERGGSAGLLLRVAGRSSAEYAAATRWLVRPAPGRRTVQRWSVQLLHGHGGRIGSRVFLEHHRDTHLVRATAELADRQAAPTRALA